MAKTKKIQAMPFNTADWLRCPELKVLSPDVKGLWMDMLCYMWESPVRGVMVKPNGTIYTKAEIIRLLGCDSFGSSSWIDKLIDAKVCGIREDGAIFSRRMCRDVQLSEKRRNAGLRGGNRTSQYWDQVKKDSHEEPVKDKPEEVEMALFPTDPPALSPEQLAKIEKAKKYKYAECVTLTRDEYSKLLAEYSEEDVKGMIEVLDNYKGQNGKRYKSDYKAIQNWVVTAYYERKSKQDNGRKFTKNSSNPQTTSGFGKGTTL